MPSVPSPPRAWGGAAGRPLPPSAPGGVLWGLSSPPGEWLLCGDLPQRTLPFLPGPRSQAGGGGSAMASEGPGARSSAGPRSRDCAPAGSLPGPGP